MHEAKTTKISNFWTFWPVIHLIHHLLTSGHTQHQLLSDFEKMAYKLNYMIFAVFALCIASILKSLNPE